MHGQRTAPVSQSALRICPHAGAFPPQGITFVFGASCFRSTAPKASAGRQVCHPTRPPSRTALDDTAWTRHLPPWRGNRSRANQVGQDRRSRDVAWAIQLRACTRSGLCCPGSVSIGMAAALCRRFRRARILGRSHRLLCRPAERRRRDQHCERKYRHATSIRAVHSLTS